ncbi:hydrolase [Pseudofrankia inefficax]|uniref:Acyl-CoA dehydrogenase type 2 domain protein n=1 Tax=Pseudofrankia inefficax (strain DSM 45817 / CECT 9037 / DDB 130130 / EuI1c) TaxID=298654 RepID=E3J3N9_PSEI1|nr:hydrolase [Pseudofrankia inefficax]ADP79376.1 Acyl-CoA dehydrogenase type 2 domain protein [Pseudofrankia inefficax]
MSTTINAGHDLVHAARRVAGIAAEHASDANRHRRLHPDVVEAITEAGFLRAFVPSAVGGAAGSLREFSGAVAAVGERCASAAWVASVSAYVGRMAGFLPAPGWAEVWSAGPDTLLVGALMPAGSATAVPGGWLVSGEWAYISAVDFSAWALVCALAPGDGGPQARFFAVPREAYSIRDTWHTTGMRGTGSNTLVLPEVFVPAHRSVARSRIAAGQGSDSPAPCHNVPLGAINGLAFGGPALGAARGMLAAWSATTARKLGGGRGRPVDRAAFDGPLTWASAGIDTAELLFDRVAATADAGDPGPLLSARGSRDSVVAISHLVDAANRVFAASGSSAQAEDSPIGRAWRDVHAAASHVAVRFEPAAAAYADEILRAPA